MVFGSIESVTQDVLILERENLSFQRLDGGDFSILSGLARSFLFILIKFIENLGFFRLKKA